MANTIQVRLAQFVCVCSNLFLVFFGISALFYFSEGVLGIVFTTVRNLIAYGFLLFLPLAIHVNRCIWLRAKEESGTQTGKREIAAYFYSQIVSIRWSWFCGPGAGGALIFALFDFETRGTSNQATQAYLVIGIILAILGVALSLDVTQRYAYSPDDDNMPTEIPE